MKKENADPENPKKPLRSRLWARENFFSKFFSTHLGTTPQSWEKLGAVPAKTSKTLSSKARWPGKRPDLTGKCFKQEVVPGLF